MNEKNYLKLENEEMEKIKLASAITLTDYELENNFISTYSLMCVIEDLLIEIDRLEEEKNYMIENINDNYKQISVAEQVGIYDEDFI